MRVVLDILRPDSGTVTWAAGRTRSSARDLGYLPEERGLYAKMKVLDQLVFFAKLHGVKPKAAERETRDWLDRFRIPEYADRRAEQLSKGNQQKIQFIAAILHDPQVLLMDEPSPASIRSTRRCSRRRSRDEEPRQDPHLSTHQMETVEELCEAIAILDAAGSLLAETSATCAARPVGRWCGSPWRAILRSTGSRRSTAFASRGAARTTSKRRCKGFDPELFSRPR